MSFRCRFTVSPYLCVSECVRVCVCVREQKAEVDLLERKLLTI